jgi:phosphomannomutase / phosphoglucomutase
MALVESFSGVRGIYSLDLDEIIARKYTSAFSCFLKSKNKNNKNISLPLIVVGRDTRTSGELLKKAVVDSAECRIIDVGILPTAAIEHAVRHFHADGGIIITASHNEPEYNGFKFLDNDGAVLRPNDMNQLIQAVHADKLADYKEKKDVSRIELSDYSYKYDEALNSYKNSIVGLLSDSEKLFLEQNKIKIIIDPNGGTGTIAKIIFDEMGIYAEYVNMKNSVFSRIIEPTKDSLKPLANEVIKHNASFGAGFDCDADRVEFVLKDGSLVSGNHTLAIIVDYILFELAKNSAAKEDSANKAETVSTIVVNDATSYLVKSVVDKHNALWKEVEVGEINVVDAMLSVNSPAGGEGSNGGVIIPPARCRDGILAIIYLLKAMAKSGIQLEGLFSEMPKFYYFKDKVVLRDDFSIKRSALKKHYADSGFKIVEISDETGGFKAIKNESWVWFRQSKTEDKILRIIADSKNENTAKELIANAKLLLG